MAKRKKKVNSSENTKPKFPYTNAPNDLRKLLQFIPQKPKPSKLNGALIKTWGIKNNNAVTALAVLKDLNILDASNTPTDTYAGYMAKETGGNILGQKLRERYKELFEAHQEPQNSSNEDLKTFFNINSGGSESTIDFQVRTFKVLAEFAKFDGTMSVGLSSAQVGSATGRGNSQIHFDIHIHLPEGKSTSDYDSIIRSLSEHIFNKAKI